MRKILLLTAMAVSAMLAASCNGNNGNNNEEHNPEPPAPEVQAAFAKGADIGWATEMAGDGIKFYNAAGEERECTALMKELGFDAVRYRVWVNPAEGWCGKEDVVAKARIAKDLGMRIMINFHYSDSWADPSKQYKPAAWEDYNLEQLCQAVMDHTRDVLSALNDEDITPEWVQVGNETSNGMLWETGKADPNMANYAMLTAAGYKAVKEIFPKAKVIVHLDHGDRPDLYNWIFDGLKANGAEWDMIGMSLYPEYYAHDIESDYQKGEYVRVTDAAVSNALALYQKYGTPVMITEVGMTWSKVDESYAFLSELLAKARALGDGKACAGVFYWEPESNPVWGGYAKGAFDENFRPTKALDAFKN